MNAKEAECDNMGAPCGTARTTARAAGDVSAIKNQSNIVGTLQIAGITGCS